MKSSLEVMSFEVLAESVGTELEACVIFVNENENENGEKRENNEFVNEN